MPGDAVSPDAMPTPSSVAIERFKRAASGDPRVSLRPMFGNLAAFANGYMFAGLFGDDVFVRTDASREASMIERGGSAFSPMPGRPMRGYVVLPDAMVRDEATLRSALDESLTYTMGLPPKASKAAKTAKTAKAGKGGADS